VSLIKNYILIQQNGSQTFFLYEGNYESLFRLALIEAWQAFDNGRKYLPDTQRRMLQLINAWFPATKRNEQHSTGNQFGNPPTENSDLHYI